ncbi:MAG TPA: ATP-binding protein [Solirubrobacteraceae bacterium]
MRLSARMALASGALGAVLAVVFIVLVLAIGSQRDAARDARMSEQVIALASDLRARLLDLETGERGFLLTSRESYLVPFNHTLGAWPAEIGRLQHLVVDDRPQARLAVEIRARWQTYVRGYALPLVARARHGLTRAQSVTAVQQGKSQVDRLRGLFASFTRHEEALAATRDADATRSARRARILGAAGLAFLLAFVALLAWGFSRSVVRPIRRVAGAARGLAEGDLAARVPRREGGSEVSELGRAFNTMAASMQDQRGRLEEQNRTLAAQRAELEGAVDRLGQEKERMARYAAFGRRLDSASDVDTLGATILDQLAELVGAERGALYAVESERPGRPPAILAERALTEPPPALPTEGPVARALEQDHVIQLGERDAARLLAGDTDAGPELIVPLVHAGTAAGLLVLAASAGRSETVPLEDVESLGRQAAAALASALALRRAREGASVIRAVLDTTPDAIALLDRNGRTVLENPPMRTVRQALVESVRTPGGGYRTNVNVLGADPSAEVRDELELLGTGRTFARYAAPVRDGGGELIGRLTVLREITGEREADRLKDEFFALVSHELRTPLTSIIGYLELVLDEVEGIRADQRHYLEVVQRNATRLLRLVGDLLFVAQVEAGKLSLDPGAVDLPQLVHEAVDTGRPRAEARGIALRAEVEPVEPIWGDRDRLGQVLDNLVTNALKFTPEDGTVTVRLTRAGARVIVEVEDTGMGIPRDEQSRLFDRFFRASTATAQAVPGVGLGLTIVKAILEAHGGTVGVESEPGRGTTFRIDLPLRAPERAREGGTSGQSSELGAGSGRATGSPPAAPSRSEGGR